MPYLPSAYCSMFTSMKIKREATCALIRLTVRQEWISAFVDIDLVRVRIGAALTCFNCGCFAVIPRRVGGTGVDDLDEDFLHVGFVGDGVALAARGAGAEGRSVGIVGWKLVGGATFWCCDAERHWISSVALNIFALHVGG